ncbi:MAG: molybdenum cofactor synthesis domain-containing protein [Thermoplasmataceae archaeon]
MGKIFRNLVPFSEARALAMKHARPVSDIEVIPTSESTGRISAEDIFAEVPLPPFTRSEVDGYAVISTDIENASPENPVYLSLAGKVEIGDSRTTHPGPGKCMYIATGAVIPAFCDSVVMVEDATQNGQRIIFTRSVSKWENIAHSGEDLRKGAIIVRNGSIIDPRMIGVMCATGIEKIRVYRKLRIGIASSGNELIQPGEQISAGKVYESNSTYVESELSGFRNVSTRKYGLIRDDLGEIESALKKMVDENDAVIVSGGTSAGEGDFVYRAMESCKPGIIFHGVAVKPGTPTVFALSGEKPMYGLPGFPVSAMMIFRTVFLPAIERMSGERLPDRTVEAKLGMKTLIRIGYTSLIILRLARRGDAILAYPVNGASGSISRLLDAEGFAVIEGNRKFADAGDKVEVHLFTERIPELVFLGIPDEIVEKFIARMESMPAVIRMEEDSVPDFIREIKPDFALVSGSEGIDPSNFGDYSSAAAYDVPFGFYSRDDAGTVKSIIESISAGKSRVVSISGNDSVASGFRNYLAAAGWDSRPFGDHISYLPTREACLSSLENRESDFFLGKFRKMENHGLKFTHIGEVHQSILLCNETVSMQALEKSLQVAREAIAGLALP